MTDAGYIIILILLTLSSGYFSGSEIALFSLSSHKVRTYQGSTNRRKKIIARLLSRPRDLLVTVLIMNTVINILLQNVCSSMFGAASSWWYKVGVPLGITLIIGEIIPKYIAMQKNVSFAQIVAPSIAFFTKALRPFREFTVLITTPISQAVFFFLKKEGAISMEEIHHVLVASLNSGVLNKDEVELIEGYLELENIHVKEMMRPREDVIYYNTQDPLDTLASLFADKQCTRVPVAEGSLENVLGIVSANDFFLYRPLLKQSSDLKHIFTKPLFLPETTPARLMHKRLKEKNERLALVVDEHRSIVGLVTAEDLVEEVVGEISDQRDADPLYEVLSESVIVASGKLELDNFNDHFNVNLQSDSHMITLGGWLTEQFGDLPKPGMRHETEEFFFQVLSAEPTRIRRIYARKKK